MSDPEDPRERWNQSFLLSDGSENTKIRSSKQERRIAEQNRGRAVRGSGCNPENPSDVVLPAPGLLQTSATEGAPIRVECKRTDSKGLYLSDKVLDKIEAEAAAFGHTPVLQVDLDGRPRGRKQWYVIPAELWDRLYRGEDT